MLRRECDDNQPFTASTFPLFATAYISIAITLGLILPILAIPRMSPPAGDSSGDPAISSLISWIRDTGKPSKIREMVAEQLGLPATDLAVIERGFRKEGERLTHVCSTGVLRAPDLLFVASVDETSGDAKVWRVSRKGDVVASAVFIDQVARRIQSSKTDMDFASEMSYFLGKASASPIKTVAKPSTSEAKSGSTSPRTLTIPVRPGRSQVLLPSPYGRATAPNPNY